jgi:hypothetical protein
MKAAIKIGFPFTPDIEKNMKMFYESLNEKDRRHYAALEAKKLSIQHGRPKAELKSPQ